MLGKMHLRNAGLIRSRSTLRASVLALAGLFLSACVPAEKKPDPSAMTGEKMIAIMSWVADCEHRAANRYDDGRSTISALADQVMGVCTVERFKARQAFHLSPNDPDLDLDDFKRAVEVVEDERKNRPR
jgi:hypothetical protein